MSNRRAGYNPQLRENILSPMPSFIRRTDSRASDISMYKSTVPMTMNRDYKNAGMDSRQMCVEASLIYYI